MKELYYKVAEHVFVLMTGEHDSLIGGLRQYEPFLTDATDNITFRLEIVEEMPVTTFHEETKQEEEGQVIVIGHLDDGSSYFEFWLKNELCAVMIADKDYRQAQICLKGKWKFGLNNAFMVMYTIATANSQTALFHSSVVS